MVPVVLGVATLLRGAVPFVVPVVLAVLLYLRFIRSVDAHDYCRLWTIRGHPD